MPPIPVTAVVAAETQDKTQPYVFHGLDLTSYGNELAGECPFCGKAKKFYVAVDSGQYQCKVCGESGNAVTFLRTLWARSMAATKQPDLAALANDRSLLDAQTVSSWGGCKSMIDNTWLLPGYDAQGRLHQLYRRTRFWNSETKQHSFRLLPTPGIWTSGHSHGFHTAISTFDLTKPSFDILEGPWDGMAIWEVMSAVKQLEDGNLIVTSDPQQSLLATSNVLAVPGCGSFMDHWLPMFRGKDVRLWYDSDHPQTRGELVIRPGFDAARRVTKKLSGIAKSISWCAWGDEGYDLTRKDGWDVRDHLSQDDSRVANLLDLLSKQQPTPAGWLTLLNKSGASVVKEVEAIHCEGWKQLEDAWTSAQEWRQVSSDVLAVMLAVCASTMQGGGQLFLQVIGSASSGKTTLCDGLLVSDHCHSLEHLSGFHSGWKKPGDDQKDCSLIARINGKTLVTPEGDVLMSSPKFAEIMSQCRRIFDGTSGSTYKNDDIDRLYVGLRTPWIMAGTPALMDTDQSRLGDRFLRIIMSDPTEEEKRRICLKAFRSEMRAMLETSNGTAGSILNPALRKAYALTGGYVDWLRANIEQLVVQVKVPEKAELHCVDLGLLTADLRARPNWDPRKHETHASKEMPYRIACQLGRMARCLAVVYNKTTVDNDIMRVVRKIAFDSAHGHTLNIVRWLRGVDPKSKLPRQELGLPAGVIARWMGLNEKEKVLPYLIFLLKIDVLQHIPLRNSAGLWKLTNRVDQLYTAIMEN